MDELIYTDKEGEYYLLDFHPSHSQLVIRKRNRTTGSNIDLLFKSVDSIFLKIRLQGIQVFRRSRNNYPINPYNRSEIYEIKDFSGYIGYIDATVFVVFQNNFES